MYIGSSVGSVDVNLVFCLDPQFSTCSCHDVVSDRESVCRELDQVVIYVDIIPNESYYAPDIC